MRPTERATHLGAVHLEYPEPQCRHVHSFRRARTCRGVATLRGGCYARVTLREAGNLRRKTVDAGGLKPNTWQRFERLSSAWNQAKLGVADAPKGTTDNEPGVVANPRRRARTPLTAKQVDSIRTARENGESVLSIARRFDVHRATVWEYTRKPVATSSADSG